MRAKLLVSLVLGLALTTACAGLGINKDDGADEGLVGLPTWPRHFATSRGERLVVYQPQIISWERHEVAEARAVISFSRSTLATPALGTIYFRATTDVDLESRRVRVSDFELLETRFPTLSSGEAERLAKKIEADVMPDDMVTTLDHFVANVERSEQAASSVAVKTDPPPIFVSNEPALLLQFDGAPILSPIEGSGLRYALNTNWDVLVEPESGTFYLLAGDAWLSAPEVAGPWEPAGALPPAFASLPDDDNWKQVRENLPGRSLGKDEVPRVFVSEQPAELILIDGELELESIAGTQLQSVANTESDLLLSLTDGNYYYLVSGRWFRAADLSGPWTFATPDLPADFAKIPDDHPRSSVRALVPGTPEAQESVLLAQIPQRATVQRDQAKPTVTYSGGEPEFEAVEGTAIAYAKNTPSDVLRVGDLYYLCFQGVWFVSASATGPWETADAVPDAIYSIPPSSPVYHVTYVVVYSSTPTTVVVGYTPGYMGMYYAYGCVMWGTGWYYSPYYYYGGYYPYYYSYPVSYGFSSWYNPATGFYGRGAVAYGPYGGIGRGAAYNPATGTYARGGAAWGPNNAGAWGRAYNPRTGAYGATRQGANAYGSWGSSVVGRGDNWARTAHYSDSRGTVGAIQTSRGGAAVVGRGEQGSGVIGRTAGGDLYAGKDGNVYRSGDSGWEKHGSTGWDSVSSADREAARQGAQDRLGSADRAAAGERSSAQDRARRDAELSRRTREMDRRSNAGGGSRGTLGQLDRDRSGRINGARSHQRYKTSSRGGGQRGGFGGSRGGGGARGGGGGRRR